MSDGQTHGEALLKKQSAKRVPKPGDDNVLIQLGPDGPWVDLGCNKDDLIAGTLDTLSRLAKESKRRPGFVLSPIVSFALRKIREAKGRV